MSSSLGIPSRLQEAEYPSWWVDHGQPGEVDAEAEPVLRYLLTRAAGGQDSLDPVQAEELVADVPLESIFGVVSCVEEALDRAMSVPNGESGSAIVAARRRVHRCNRELCEAAIRVYTRQSRHLLRDISHDIRKPLNSIVFLANGLYTELSGRLDPSQKQQVGTLYVAATSLMNLVNDLLDLSRAEEDQKEGTAEVPFSIDGVLDDVMDLIVPVARHQQVELDVRREVSGAYRGDPHLVSRVLINLVLNAVEATDEDGQVRVSVSGGKGGQGLRLVVADDGPGVDRERVQELLTASDSGWMQLLHEGTEGLGLLIVGRLIRRAGGRIALDTTSQPGTTFTVYLPFASA